MFQIFLPQWTDCIWHSWIPQANQTIEFESKIVTVNKLNRRFEHSTNSQKSLISGNWKLVQLFQAESTRVAFFYSSFFAEKHLQEYQSTSICISNARIRKQNTFYLTIPDNVLCCLLFGDWLRLFEIPSVVIFVSVH